jgi:chromosome partitioning protein
LAGVRKANRIHVSRSQILALIAPVPIGGAPVVPNGAARVIAVANQKGGTGKTTTAVALAAILGRDTPVLAVDCDPQGNMTQAFGFDPDEQDPTLYNVLVEDSPIHEAFLSVGPPPHFLSLIPANLDLADTWRRVAGKIGLEGLLKAALLPLMPSFSYIVLDCPPSLDMITMNALVAATEVIVPVDMSVFSVRGMVKLMGTMDEVRKVNPALPAPHVLACRTDNTAISQAIEERIRESFAGNVFRTAIPRGKDVPAAHAAKRPLPYHAPDSKASQAYEALAEEVRHGYGSEGAEIRRADRWAVGKGAGASQTHGQPGRPLY